MLGKRVDASSSEWNKREHSPTCKNGRLNFAGDSRERKVSEGQSINWFLASRLFLSNHATAKWIVTGLSTVKSGPAAHRNRSGRLSQASFKFGAF